MDASKGGPDSSFNDSLIREVRQNPMVYDAAHPLYGNALRKQEAWSEIAAKLNEKVEAVKTRWRTLRDRYTKERRRVMTCGGGSSFSYYADLSFLDNHSTENRISRRGTCAGGSVYVKPEVFEQASDAGGAEFDGHQVDCNRTDTEEISSSEKQDVSLPNSDHLPTNDAAKATAMAAVVIEQTATATAVEEVAPKRVKLETLNSSNSSPNPSTDSVAEALMRSAEALQRLAERKSIFDRSTSGPRDADECFADFVCMSLKSIDNESRVHARIAILHALAQFQT